MNDIWETEDLPVILGCQLRAGKQQQRNPWPVTDHYPQGWRARVSRLIRSLLERN